MKITEVDFAKKIIAYLEDLKWDVYQEVQFYSGSACADIAAVQGNLLWIIECKLSCSLSVIEQAWKWKKTWRKTCPNLISIAVPKPSPIAYKICSMLGIGILKLTPYGRYEVSEYLKPKLIRISSKDLRSKIRPEHKYYCEAGTATGGQLTQFKITCEEVRRYVERNPGIKLKDLITKINHHYSSNSSAQQCLSLWIQKGIVPGVEKRIEGRYAHIYPKPVRERKAPIFGKDYELDD